MTRENPVARSFTHSLIHLLTQPTEQDDGDDTPTWQNNEKDEHVISTK